jgi:magnesium-dependent phosphatase 1
VFDLDGCVWYPEMFMLWGKGGAPFTPEESGDVKSAGGEDVYLMGDCRDIMRELATESKWKDTVVAVASKCDEPK